MTRSRTPSRPSSSASRRRWRPRGSRSARAIEFDEPPAFCVLPDALGDAARTTAQLDEWVDELTDRGLTPYAAIQPGRLADRAARARKRGGGRTTASCECACGREVTIEDATEPGRRRPTLVEIKEVADREE